MLMCKPAHCTFCPVALFAFSLEGGPCCLHAYLPAVLLTYLMLVAGGNLGRACQRVCLQARQLPASCLLHGQMCWQAQTCVLAQLSAQELPTLPLADGLQAKGVDQGCSSLRSGCPKLKWRQWGDSLCGMTRILPTEVSRQVEPRHTAAGQSDMGAVPRALAGSCRVL